jgi:hypothetical protein
MILSETIIISCIGGLTLLNCRTCGQHVPASVRDCPSCQADVGFPNVRSAETPEERAALQQRLADAETSAQARGCESTLRDFGRAVLRSKAVICRNLAVVLSLVSNDNALYANYYRQSEGEVRLPENNPFDRGRSAVDGTLFPNYHRHICFAALSLNNLGPTRYGSYTIVLKDKMIFQRATVFEENSFSFCQTKHRIVVGDPIPAGYRAVWGERDKLAVAKLHSRIEAKTRPEEYPTILLHQGGDPLNDDFIEVHIWGPIHRTAIERVVGPRPTRREDRALWNSLATKLNEVGAALEVG